MAGGFVLRLHEDTLDPGARLALPAATRVLYVLRGEMTVEAEPGRTRVQTGHAWHGAGAARVEAGGAGAAVLEHALDLEPAGTYLMRADRVDFAPGGVALPHRHRGGGIRCLIEGALEVRIGDGPGRRMTPGMAWFESGREPVLATASPEAPTSFIRVAILPREILGRTSILYVDPADAARGKPRRYTVFVDAPIAL